LIPSPPFSLTRPTHANPDPHQRTELTVDERQELDEAFQMFDAEQTGRIDLHELKVLMRALGFPVKKAQVLKMAQEVDPNHGGAIDYDAYLEISELCLV